jgi:hypothetical protein
MSRNIILKFIFFRYRLKFENNNKQCIRIITRTQNADNLVRPIRHRFKLLASNIKLINRTQITSATLALITIRILNMVITPLITMDTSIRLISQVLTLKFLPGLKFGQHSINKNNTIKRFFYWIITI